MSTTIWAIIGTLVLIIIARFIEEYANRKSKKNNAANNQKYHYNKKYYFFSKNELFFYRDLAKIATDLNLTLFAKPRLADIIEPQKGTPNWNACFSKIKSKHVDFLLCNTPQIRPALVIELDDNSHNTEKRMQRDSFVDHALQEAGIPILHVRGSGNLIDKIKEALQCQPGTS